MGTTLRYERKIAKRDHKRKCEMTGLPIEKGDRYFEGVFVDGGDFAYIKTHSILQEMAHESMSLNHNHDEGWDPWEVEEYLLGWLRRNIDNPTWEESIDHFSEQKLVDHPDVTACLEAARKYWKGNNNE